MGRTWNAKNRGDRQHFRRWYTKGKTVYVINEHAMIPGQFDKQTSSAMRCSFAGPFALDAAENFLLHHGTVYEDKPGHVRHLGDPEPDCRTEGWNGLRRGKILGGRLDAAEVDAVDAMAGEAEGRYKDDRQAGRRTRWFG